MTRWRLPLVAGGVSAIAALALLGVDRGRQPTVGSRAASLGHLRPTSLEVSMSEYRFDYRPSVAAGRVVLTVRNVGQELHLFGLYVLPEDVPPIEEQLRGSDRREIESLVELPPMAPEGSAVVALDLVPGSRYAFLCLLNTPPSRDSHARLGMSAEFRVA